MMRYLSMATGKLYIPGIFLALAGCMAGSKDVESVAEPVRIPVVYSRYLTYPVPSMGVEVAFNPPVLRWPVANDDDVRYEVRISRDSSFEDQAVLREFNTTWAMINTHEALEEGAWYWQYRISGKDWSDVQGFLVTSKTPKIVSPTSAKFLSGIPESHPRVLTDKVDLRKLRLVDRDADAKAILRDADEAMDKIIPTEKDGISRRKGVDKEQSRKFQQEASKRLGDFAYRSVESLCQAYLLSGAERYRLRATMIALEVARWDPSGVSGAGVSDFSDARCMLAMALVYDTYYHQLTLKEKSLLKDAVGARAERFYRSWVNNQEARVLSGHVWQHILHYFFQTSIAMYGHEPKAADWLAYAYELFLARTPILGDKNGGWAEGASYFRMNMEMLLEIPLFIRKFTGFDFVKAHPFYVNNIDWLIYHVPPGSSADGFGDNTEEVFSPGVEYAAYARELAKLTGSALASWYAEACGQYEKLDLSTLRTLRWVRLARTRDLKLPDPTKEPDFSIAKHFPGTGLVSMHSNPGNTDTDLMVAMRSSSFGSYGHFLSDQNAFNILYGGRRTFFRTGYKVSMQDPHRTGWYQHTKSNNSVLIDGEGQPYSTEAFGLLPKFIEGEKIAYAMGDASNAYSSEQTGEDYGVKKFFRHLVFLKPDIIVIYDELESEADARWSWLIHSMKEIEVDASENKFKSYFDHATGVGQLWSSEPVSWALTDTFDVPAINWRGSYDASGILKTYDDGQWHLKAESMSKVKSMRYLTLLQVGPDAGTEVFKAGVDQGRVNVSVGSWKVSANMDIDQGPGLIITDQVGGIAFSTHGERMEIGGAIYARDGITRLVSIVDGKPHIQECSYDLPVDVIQSWRYHTNRFMVP